MTTLVSKINLIIVVGVITVLGSLWLIPGPDKVGATVRVEFEKQVQQGQERQALVMLDSNVPVNAIDIAVSYPTESLDARKADKDQSDFETTIFEPQLLEDDGKVKFVQASLDPFEGKDGLVGTIDFRALKPDQPKFSVEGKVIRHDGSGDNVFHDTLHQSVGQWLVAMVIGVFS